ncbi:MAG: hypothetical protein A2504_13215 [Bdellovibrionales bacterium RIFOXYD12_FULL_39_22]|nr:MAG: hypothetical protein A2385_01015 [Bdellovibrionales bacterium RIFOXYB1_FULL_39_21]OFZ43587.1 MAG: hypothetical protein A2485_12685 [Bdellovibrionales bacterium RIFOXYC12_FULL_39_17]OFZ44606.1 MAG: hypothetical protein A2404_10375 [Bdellovibrionales bacterium RIFOXYC1_FULL_39_130]OFZ70577.1 MAG: hypothetical protein A2451_15165 [Bdellovibrionales bacterium RIFOXYC2_FULL_39_8]OFZ76365.1 MAG: hypothetical protein A2560_06995 [Bdellovibrionales bacterium RIFOXYD1_FULL_39_84]OFZ94631.1 MAG:
MSLKKALLILTVFLLTTNVFAMQFLEREIPDKIVVDGKELALNGVGVRTVSVAFIDIKVYLGSLYLEKKTTNHQDVLAATTPVYLGMKYLREVDRDKLVDGWQKAFKATHKDVKPYQASLDKFFSTMEAMKENDESNLTFYLDRGVKVATKGKEVFIEDKGFAKALLSVWFNKKSDQKLQAGLLGKSK